MSSLPPCATRRATENSVFGSVFAVSRMEASRPRIRRPVRFEKQMSLHGSRIYPSKVSRAQMEREKKFMEGADCLRMGYD